MRSQRFAKFIRIRVEVFGLLGHSLTQWLRSEDQPLPESCGRQEGIGPGAEDGRRAHQGIRRLIPQQ